MTLEGILGSFLTNNAIPSKLIDNAVRVKEGKFESLSPIKDFNAISLKNINVGTLNNYKQRNYRRLLDRAVNVTSGIGAGIGVAYLGSKLGLTGRFKPLAVGAGLASGLATMKGVEKLQHRNKDLYNLPTALHDVVRHKLDMS